MGRRRSTACSFTRLNWLVSLTIITLMIGAVYKVLPDLYLRWRDVAVGALVTAALLDHRQAADRRCISATPA